MIRIFRALTCVGFCLVHAVANPTGFLKNGVTAHRGNSGEFPENTMPAFESALALGVDWIETDIYLTKDGRVIISHDSNTSRTGDKNLVVNQINYAELQAVDVAARFRTSHKLSVEECPPLQMPLLEDVLALVMRQEHTRISLQPKDECVQAAFDIIQRMGAKQWVGFNDGSLRKMQQVKSLDPQVPVFWDRGAQCDLDKDIPVALKEGFESLVVNCHGLTRPKVEQIHQAGLESGVWTANTEAELQLFLDMGVQRIYTDYPARLLQLKEKLLGGRASLD